MKPPEGSGDSGFVAWLCGIIVVIAAAAAATPRLCRAIISIARMAVAVNDAMPLVIRLPAILKAHGETLEKQNGVLAEIQQDVKALKEKDKVSAD